MTPAFRARLGSLSASGLILWATLLAAQEQTRPPEGLRDKTPKTYLLVGARIVAAPGRVIPRGSILIRDGKIAAVGAELRLPEGARLCPLEGKTIYPGLIDGFSEVSVAADQATRGAAYWNRDVRPQLSVADAYQADAALNKKLRSQGVTARLAAPSGGIIKGYSALVMTGDEPPGRALIVPRAAQHLRLNPPSGRGRDQYPNSPMGAVALVRQALCDAQWYQQAWQACRADSQLARPETNEALAALAELLEQDQLVVIDAADEQYLLRADRVAREFQLRIAVRGSGREYRRLDAVRATGRVVIIPVDFPEPPNVATAEATLNVSLERLLHWDLAPENPARLDRAGVPIVLTSHGLDDPGKFLGAVRKAVRRGLSPDAALRALTTTPAELFGASQLLGAIEPGKAANLVVTDGDLFQEKTKLLATWVDGQCYPLAATPPYDVTGEWRIDFARGKGAPNPARMRLRRQGEKLSGDIVAESPAPEDKQEGKTSLGQVGLRDARLSCVFNAQSFDRPGQARLTAVISCDDDGTLRWTGRVVWPDGESHSFSARRPPQGSPSTDAKDPESAEPRQPQDPSEPPRDGDSRQASPAPAKDGPALFPVNYPLGAFGRSQPPPQPEALLVRNAVIWTCGDAATLEGASLLVLRGKIAGVGYDLQAPHGALVIDAKGKHVTPGIIDCHSHMATDGGVNESSQAISAEVRIADFLDANDISIYRQLAGGVTISHVLHGSSNPIGGQNQAIKLRWGALPDELKFAEAPPTIKFAQGENVKQSNAGEQYNTRYPQTRMGVDQIVRDELQAALEYQRRWRQWLDTHEGLPPRRDLELEAIVEVLEGRRWVHCHSYRQDEILAALRTFDDFGVHGVVFQHVLEGYKVADEMARRGAMASAFSDWWGYKFEVFDAIPYNGALMRRAGVVVSFNSDSDELARRLNTEAAKAMRYGGVPPEEALKMVTINPAVQLRAERFVGSLEEGKDADFVIWSGPPLSNYSRCEQTWIDGCKYFDGQDDARLRADAARMRAALVQKILSPAAPVSPPRQERPQEQQP